MARLPAASPTIVFEGGPAAGRMRVNTVRAQAVVVPMEIAGRYFPIRYVDSGRRSEYGAQIWVMEELPDPPATQSDESARRLAARLVEQAPSMAAALDEMIDRLEHRWWHRILPFLGRRARLRRAQDAAEAEAFLDRIYGGDQTDE